MSRLFFNVGGRIMPYFHDRLRDARVARGIKQSDLAASAGINPAAVSKYETGRSEPNFSSLKAIALCLGVSADYLLGLSDSMLPSRLSAEAVPTLSQDEAALMESFRKLPQEYRREVKGYINGIISSLHC